MRLLVFLFSGFVFNELCLIMHGFVYSLYLFEKFYLFFANFADFSMFGLAISRL